MDKLRIVFMGTPDFAVGILDHIIKHGYNVVGVITAADKPAGRGQKIRYSAVKEYAMSNNLHLLQPTNLKDTQFLGELEKLQANVQVVVAFRMLPRSVWSMPLYGTFNLHASLLPDYRGAAPINWAIMNGDKQTGVTTFFIDDKIDTGEIILSKETHISNDDTAGTLHDRLMALGSEAVVDTLALIGSGNVQTTPQLEFEGIREANKLTKENCRIDWTKTASEIYDHIRGLSPYPAAWTAVYNNGAEQHVRIYMAAVVSDTHKFETGTIIVKNRTVLVAVADGFISLTDLQFPGKRRMSASDLLNGLSFSEDAKAF